MNYVWFWAFLLVSTSTNAQKCIPIFAPPTDMPKILLGCCPLSDTLCIQQKINKTIDKWKKEGYLAASLVKTHLKDDTIRIEIYKGPQLKHICLKNNKAIAFYLDSCMSVPVFLKTNNKILKNYQQNGYPFASIFLDSLVYDSLQKHYLAWPVVNPGPLIVFDSIHLPVGTAANALNRRFLSTWLGWKRGKPYRHSVIGMVEGRLAALPFLRTSNTIPLAKYFNNEAHLYIDAQTVPVSKIDGVLGLAPSPNNATAILTGELNLHLENISNRAIALVVEARRIRQNTSKIYLQSIWRAPLGVPLVVQGDFSLLRQDTFMLIRSARVQVGVLVGAGFLASVFASPYTATPLGRLPNAENIASRRTSYGFLLEKRKLDQPFFTRKGHQFRVEISSAQKKWGTANKRSMTHHTALVEAGFYTQMSKWVLYSRVQARIQASDSLSFGEAYQIGGFASLRGFAENGLLSHRYVISGIEARYFFESQAYINIFTDLAVLNLVNSYKTSIISGVGLGLNFATKTGIFSFGYALPATQTRFFAFEDSKIYFGFTARF